MAKLRAVPMKEAARYLGYGDSQPDEVIVRMMSECEAPLQEACGPAFGYGVFDIVPVSETELALSECAMRLTGHDIVKHLEGCSRVILMAVTLGAGVDALLRQLQVTNMPNALLTDAMAGALLEQLCDDIQLELQEHFPTCRQTWRFSPGYGDLPLSLQPEFLATLEAGKRLGLHVTESGMLTPMKSVTAIVGLADAEETSQGVNGAISMELPSGACASGAGCATCAMSGRCGMRSPEEAAKQREGEQDE